MPEHMLARRVARLAAVQALYQLDISEDPIDRVINEFRDFRFGQEIEDVDYTEPDFAHFNEVVRGVGQNQLVIDRALEDALTNDWSLLRFDRTLRALLRAAAFELRTMTDIPAKVVINEYVELAHGFFAENEPGLVNAILDRLHSAWRFNP